MEVVGYPRGLRKGCCDVGGGRSQNWRISLARTRGLRAGGAGARGDSGQVARVRAAGGGVLRRDPPTRAARLLRRRRPLQPQQSFQEGGRAGSRWLPWYRGAAARMEPNVRFWISERQSFVRRFLQWTDLLDPLNLFISVEQIEKARQLLFTNEDASTQALEDQKIQEAWKRSLSTVHPDSSQLIPTLFRPAAFLPFTAPMVFLSMMPARGIKSIILPQVSLYTYITAFTFINGNASYSHHQPESLLLGAGAVVSSTFFGLIPHFIRMKYFLVNPLIKRALPVFFLANVSAGNVLASRSFEPVRGIQVMDKEGNVIGHSRIAARKAVAETATSRAVLFGTSAVIPEVCAYFFKRTQFFLKNPRSLWTLKLSCTILVMGLMVPVSFSMFPQMGQIQCSKLEEAIRSSTEETQLFYNRGV
ncbi:sideroflexin-4 [Nycticebus coucang]|uniref:sideroflexin-4 n=1 Tax=Nycticebus coucang TaxID=9470 RepID=UPI00234C40DD|nr:sideroflexin-4 [Nycticebus coucang]